MLPALSPTMDTGNLLFWHKNEGDQLAEGDLLCEIETDKATMGFETSEEGYLAKVFIPAGTKNVRIGKLMCIIVDSPEDIAAFKDYEPQPEDDHFPKPKAPLREAGPRVPTTEAPPIVSAHPPAAVVPPPAAAVPQAPAPVSPVAPVSVSAVPKSASRVHVSPLAKKLAKNQGIDLHTVKGSGPNGRILAADLAKAGSAPVVASPAQASVPSPVPAVAGADYVDIPLSNVRKTIAQRLSQSKSTIPHYYLNSEIVVDDLLEVRERLNTLLAASNSGADKPVKLSVNDFVIKAAALACKSVPEANSFFFDTFIRQNKNVDVSVAVSTDDGLITPIVFNAHAKGLSAINADVNALIAKARAGKLQPAEYQGGTFTVSNLGSVGSVSSFSAIVNPPQACILAVGVAAPKLVPDAELGYKTVQSISVTLSCDHRVIDGAVGAVWLKHFKEYLEKPHTMLL